MSSPFAPKSIRRESHEENINRDSHFGSRYKPQPVSTNLLQQVTCQHDSYQDLMPTVSYQRIPGERQRPTNPSRTAETHEPKIEDRMVLHPRSIVNLYSCLVNGPRRQCWASTTSCASCRTSSAWKSLARSLGSGLRHPREKQTSLLRFVQRMSDGSPG